MILINYPGIKTESLGKHSIKGIGRIIEIFNISDLPELTTGLMAAFKKQTDFAIGNILGSNIYNVLGILGISSMLQDLTIPVNLSRKIIIEEIGINLSLPTITYDAFFILVISLLFVYLLRKRKIIGRKMGAFFIAIYVLYILILI